MSLTLLALASCGDRATHQVVEPDGGTAADTSNNDTCPFPDGYCDFDSDCPPATRCEGAMHTTGVPHVFVCRGICVPSGDDGPGGGTNTTNAGIANNGCDPAGADLQATLYQQVDEVRALLRNCSQKAYFRLLGCCGEGEPLVERQADDGTWQPVGAGERRMCCDAEPVCTRFGPNEASDEPVFQLSACAAGSGTFRVRFFFSEASDCAPTDLPLVPEALSDPFEIACP